MYQKVSDSIYYYVSYLLFIGNSVGLAVGLSLGLVIAVIVLILLLVFGVIYCACRNERRLTVQTQVVTTTPLSAGVFTVVTSSQDTAFTTAAPQQTQYKDARFSSQVAPPYDALPPQVYFYCDKQIKGVL